MVKCSIGPGERAMRPIACDLDVADVDVIGVLRAEAEIPHYFGRDLQIVRIEEWERLTGDVVLKFAFLVESYLWRILFRRGLIGRRPFEAFRRHDVHPHPLLHEFVVARADKVGNDGSIVGSDQITRFDGTRVGDG